MDTPDYDVIKDLPGFKVILKAVLKFQIQQLVEQLAFHTEEESIILTANLADGTLSHLGSDSGKSFLEDHEDMKSKFLTFCLNAHQRKKQLEMLEKEILKVMPSVPSPPARYAAPRVTYSSHSSRYMSPQLHDPNLVAGIRLPAIDNIHTPHVRYEPYPTPRAIKRTMASFDEVSRTDSACSHVDEPIIKIERDEESSNQSESNVNAVNTDNSSQPSSPLEMPASSSQVNNESSDIDDADVLSVSSTSTIPYETLSDDINLDLNLSNETSVIYTSNNAPQVPCNIDTNLNVNEEVLSLPEMDLEITDVRSTKLIDSQNSWSPSVSVGMNCEPSGPNGNEQDMHTTQQEYSDLLQSTVNINWPKEMQLLDEIPSISTSNRSRKTPISVSTTLTPKGIKKKTLHSKLSWSNMSEHKRNKLFHECCWTMKSDVAPKLNRNAQSNHVNKQSSFSKTHLSLPTAPPQAPMLPLHYSSLSAVSTSDSNKKGLPLLLPRLPQYDPNEVYYLIPLTGINQPPSNP